MRFMMVVRRLLVLSAAGAFLFGSSRDAEAITYRTVALSGQPAPGVDDGAVFAGFSRPVLNRTGKVAFMGGVAGPNGAANGIWSEGTGSLALVARQGLAAPGTDANFSNTFFDPLISNGGQTAFMALVSGPGVTNSNHAGFWSDASGSLQLVVREGAPAPNAGDGTHFTRVGNGLLILGALGISPDI
jgi:hypothetical protein